MAEVQSKLPERLLLKILFHPRSRFLGLEAAAFECGITPSELEELSCNDEGPEFVQLGHWRPEFLYLEDSVRSWCLEQEQDRASGTTSS